MQKLLIFFFLLLVVGCGNNDAINDEEQENHNVEQSENANDNIEHDLEGREDVEGVDPTGLPRFPDSIRTFYIEEELTFYMAKATLDELAKFYYDFANEEGLTFEIEILDDERETQVITIAPEVILEDGIGYIIHINESEVYRNYVDWHVWSNQW